MSSSMILRAIYPTLTVSHALPSTFNLVPLFQQHHLSTFSSSVPFIGILMVHGSFHNLMKASTNFSMVELQPAMTIKTRITGISIFLAKKIRNNSIIIWTAISKILTFQVKWMVLTKIFLTLKKDLNPIKLIILQTPFKSMMRNIR